MADRDDYQFKGYSSPNYTPVPDELFDEQLPDLSGAELKVLLYIIRRTFGFKRESDNISLSQMLNGLQTWDGRRLDRGVGLTKKTLLLAIKTLEEKNIILTERRRSTEKGDEPTSYRLNVAASTVKEKTTPPVGEKLPHGGGGEITPGPWGRNYPTQETVRKTEGQTEISLSNIRNGTPKKDFGDNSVKQPVEPYQTASAAEAEPTRTTDPATTVSGGNNGFVGDPQTIRQWGMEALGDILKRKRGRPSKQELEEREMIQAFIRDFAHEFHDHAMLKSSVTRAYNIYKASGMHPAVFQDCMYQARLITKDYQSRSLIKESPMAYYFRVLEDKSGVKEHPYSPTIPN